MILRLTEQGHVRRVGEGTARRVKDRPKKGSWVTKMTGLYKEGHLREAKPSPWAGEIYGDTLNKHPLAICSRFET